ncbi:hypothetical protein POM88_008286 [Heracleum sosnowskyi]|uniref:Uncharacterized protein n=1 Tax=Heracleum sosnowskyi TaxID=360622 RepID=A0AAD8J6Z2_9APIA|nr:hypothetical protein POM88_008286 [Heracleum sosnowskyi]
MGSGKDSDKRFFSAVANPTNQMSIIGNMVAAWAAGKMGWKESATCMFTLAITHYLVIFVTLYQRLSGDHQLPARLRPVYFLFVAAPKLVFLCRRWCTRAAIAEMYSAGGDAGGAGTDDAPSSGASGGAGPKIETNMRQKCPIGGKMSIYHI